MVRLPVSATMTFALVSTMTFLAVSQGCSGRVAPDVTPENDAGSESPRDTDPGKPDPEPTPPTPPTDPGPTVPGDGGTTITYGTCANFAACGGNIAGAWSISGGCASGDAFGELRARCSGLKESNVKISAAGTLTATSTSVTRKLSTTVSASIEIPKSCLPIPACAFIGPALTSGQVPGIPKFDTATCVDSATACACNVGLTATQDSTVPYTTAGSVLTMTEPTRPRTYNYCVSGNKLGLQEVASANGNSFSIPITLEFARTGNP